MAVLTNFTEDELIINCNCGCDKGIHFTIRNYEDGDYVFLTYTNGNFYKEQHPFKAKLLKIWNIIRNRDYYYSDVVMTKEDFEQFREWVNRK